MAAALMKRVARIYADGVVTPEERLELKDFLTNYVGEDTKPNVTVFNEPPPQIIVPEREFCFTGKFIAGSREWCEDQVRARGGRAIDHVRGGLNYLVVGGVSSPAWANMNYGTKIEKAMELRQNQWSKLAIVQEEHWLQAV